MLVSDLNSVLQVSIFFSLGFTLLEDIKLTNLKETEKYILELQRALNSIEECEKRIEHNRQFQDNGKEDIADSVKLIQSASTRIKNDYKKALHQYTEVTKSIEEKLSKPKLHSLVIGVVSVLILFFGALNIVVLPVLYYIILGYSALSIGYVFLYYIHHI